MTEGMHAELAHARARARTHAGEAGELLDVCCFLQLNPFFVPPTQFLYRAGDYVRLSCFLPDFKCGLCKRQIILWDLFCLKTLLGPWGERRR